MGMIDAILMEFDRENATTRKCLERVPTDKLSWKPHEKSMSVGDLAWHLATVPTFVGSSILGDGFNFADGPKPPARPDSTDAILAAFDQGVEGAKASLAQMDDAKAMGTWTMKMGDKEIMAIPRIAFARLILLNHAYHHRGQLSVYLRLLDVPVPAIYGPSADENPFG